jgi:hypothetical protein
MRHDDPQGAIMQVAGLGTFVVASLALVAIIR